MPPKRKKGSDVPSVDKFHDILKELAPDARFTKDAVVALREVHFSFLREVAAGLVEHDTLSGDPGLVAGACGFTPALAEWTKEAQDLLDARPASNKKRKKAPKITAELEAQQEQLLQKSKAAMLEQQQKK